MEKRRVRILDENWNVENEFFVEIPNEHEKAEKEKEQLIKDYLYSNPILKLFGTLIFKAKF